MIEHPANPAADDSAKTGGPPEELRDTVQQITTLSTLLEDLDESPDSAVAAERAFQERLARGRLGIAAGLFTAMRAKHPPTAGHCLRVALGCSAWSLLLELDDQQRSEIEMGALLHDIGKIGVPELVLTKPGRLDPDEGKLMGRHRRIGLEILRSCCASASLLEILEYCSAWYDGRRPGFDRQGDDLPYGARMIAIVDAYDAMTTEHVYRRAMSRERAMAELFEHAGTQFDPQLVREFCGYVSADQVRLEAKVARRWLQELDLRASSMSWDLNNGFEDDLQDGGDSALGVFQLKLLDTMQDGVLFVDSNLYVLHWNRAAQRITGIAPESLVHQRFDPTVLRMRDEQGDFLTVENCPVARVIATSEETRRQLTISGRNDKVQIKTHISPVFNKQGVVTGATVVMHDESSQVTLEERVQVLRERATQDPLTQVANRAEFDRALAQYISQHVAENAPCSLVICDIDHFKRINDTFGHQAGDDVLINFASLLRSHGRAGDIVARYGGEEFCILCGDCDNASATRRAEEIRAKLANQAQPALNNECITASFGVTELQGGDTPETMLRRADRALYQAKDSGRNRVVQLGTGVAATEKKEEKPLSWFARLMRTPPDMVMRRTLQTAAPLNVTAEKLKGFVADHHAEIVSVKQNETTLKIDGQNSPLTRRVADRAIPFLLELKFQEVRVGAKDGRGTALRTKIAVVIQPVRKRDRRRSNAEERARQILVSLKSYFMAHEVADPNAAAE